MTMGLVEGSNAFTGLYQWRQTQMEERSVRMEGWALQNIVPLLIADLDVDRVILFGSVARREATEGSDIDLLAISGASVDHLSWKNRMGKAYEVLSQVKGTTYPVDLVVWSKEELSHKEKENSAFMQSIARDGMVLYER